LINHFDQNTDSPLAVPAKRKDAKTDPDTLQTARAAPVYAILGRLFPFFDLFDGNGQIWYAFCIKELIKL